MVASELRWLPQSAADTALWSAIQTSLLDALKAGQPVPPSLVLWTKGVNSKHFLSELLLALAPLPVPVSAKDLEDLGCPQPGG